MWSSNLVLATLEMSIDLIMGSVMTTSPFMPTLYYPKAQLAHLGIITFHVLNIERFPPRFKMAKVLGRDELGRHKNNPQFGRPLTNSTVLGLD